MIENFSIDVVVAFLIVLVGSAGCAPHRAWRTAPTDQVQPPPDQSSYLKGKNGDETFIVEFDDQGELWSQAERDFALNRINALAKEETPLTVMVFVHGWHHSAKEGDTNLDSFRRVMGDLAKSPSIKGRKWVGLYLGWRGDSISIPWLNTVTYWNRRNAAARVGGIAAAHLLADLSAVVGAKPSNMLMVVGHSFGGRVVETAVTNAMAFSENKPLVDLVILLNEASEALRAKETIDAYKEDIRMSKAPPSEAPEIVSVTSIGDLATRLAFPLGQWPVSLSLRFRNYERDGNAEEKLLPSQADLFRHTAAHTPALWSHSVKSAVSSDPGNPKGITFSAMGLEQNLKPDYVMAPLDNVFNQGTPYWIMRVPTGIIDDHDDIFNNRVRGMIAAIVAKYFKAPEVVKLQRTALHAHRWR